MRWSMRVFVEIEQACTIHMWIKYCRLVPWISAIINVYKIATDITNILHKTILQEVP